MCGLCVFLLSILTQVSSHTSSNVIGIIGHNVTLPYWAEQSSQSSRYQLLGRVMDGDISLTILDAQWSDGGVYGCRIEVPGWFNDHKVNTQLVMEEALVEQPITQDWTLVTGGRQSEQSETWTLSAPMGVEAGDSMVDIINQSSQSTKEKFKAFPGVVNIARMGAIFFSTIMIILVFIFRRIFQPSKPLERLNTSPAENIYESVPARE
ncbi:hepatitis A virus cellular receptor 1-like isoform X2 [Echeneis naucrates]|uniref:hepatitis A virus cellular receptor 1-like isoform X2 n=1 Tax=Echeneis naucrates TaxID=173247 RepID=UPI0011136CCA|nr:hepatitis A virus cellular receptor 1-like isoform X2 [Echeneis naucrates]